MKWNTRSFFLMFLAGIVTAFSIYASYASDEVLLDVVKDMVLFVAAAFISYQLAQGDAEANSEARIQDLGKATIRRIKILYSDIQSLADRVSNFDCEPSTPSSIHQERYSNTIDTLLRLQNAVKASFDEIKQTAKLPLNDSDLYDLPLTDPLTIIKGSENLVTQTSLTFPSKIACPRCKKVCDVVVAHHGGATALKVCESCLYTFNVHRRPDGNLFSGSNGATALREKTITCPNEDCKRSLTFKYKATATIVHRACPDCFQNYDYSPETEAVQTTKIKHDTVYRDIGFDGKAECNCSECGYTILGKPYLNSRNERILFCFNCGLPTLVADPSSLTHPSSTPR